MSSVTRIEGGRRVRGKPGSPPGRTKEVVGWKFAAYPGLSELAVHAFTPGFVSYAKAHSHLFSWALGTQVITAAGRPILPFGFVVTEMNRALFSHSFYSALSPKAID